MCVRCGGSHGCVLDVVEAMGVCYAWWQPWVCVRCGGSHGCVLGVVAATGVC